MSRSYLSGAKKRKLAADKKIRDDNELGKTRKINELFSAVSLASDSCSTPKAKTDEPQSDAQENTSCESVRETNILNVSPSTSVQGVEQFPVEFSSDVGLWNIEGDKLTLQNFWIGKGRNMKLVKLQISTHIFVRFQDHFHAEISQIHPR